MLKRISILLLLALSACSKDKSDFAQSDTLVRTIHTLSAGAAASLLQATTLHCADANNCPSSVGMFAAQNESDVSTCTAFLVGEDLAATNSHCIPSAVKLMPSLCGEKVKLTLPASGEFPEENFQCQKLLAVSDRPNDFSPDLALFRLDRSTKRAPLALDSRGMVPDQVYKAYKVNPIRNQPKSPTGELVAEDCATTANSYVFPMFRSESDPVFTAGCSSIPGNSGSPLVSSNGTVAGLLQASLGLTEAQKQVWSPYLNTEAGAFGEMVLGTSLRCLDLAAQNLNPSCVAFHEEDLVRPKIGDFLESSELLSETAVLIQPYLAQTENFRWARAVLERHTLERLETLEPRCIVSTGGTDPAISEAMIPTFAIRIAFNRYLQPSAHARLRKVERQQFQFSRFDLQRTGETKVQSSTGATWNITDCQ
ncbi:MAG: trypsin-like serine peptidase [Bdellovibrionota bacterium]